MNADRVSIYNEVAGLVAQSDNAIGLLQPTKQQTYCYSKHSTSHRNHASLEEEYTAYLLVIGSEIAERYYIVFLINDKHRQATYYIKACYDENERQEYVGEKLLYLHNLERVCLLFIAVLYRV